MATKVDETSRLSVKSLTGTDQAGKPTYKTWGTSYLNPVATDDVAVSIGSSLASFSQWSLSQLQRTNSYVLEA